MGLTAHTLRYYERVHLIPPIERAGNGHRRYSETDLRQIEFVKHLRSTGMPIGEIQRYVALSREGEEGVFERLAIMESHRDRLVAKIEELTGFLERIESKVAGYRARIEERKIAVR
jgi:DNA-binding transcriptional MerR regulator